MTARNWKRPSSRNGHALVVTLLPRMGVKPVAAVNGRLPQHAAAGFGHCNILKLFTAEEIIDTNMTCQGRTTISPAAGVGHTAAVALLLSSHQVRPNLPDHNGMAALSWASANGYASCVNVLLASLRVKAWYPDTSGRMGLYHAATHGHVNIFNLFLHIPGGGIDISDDSGHAPLSDAASAGDFYCCINALLGRPDSISTYWT